MKAQHSYEKIVAKLKGGVGNTHMWGNAKFLSTEIKRKSGGPYFDTAQEGQG